MGDCPPQKFLNSLVEPELFQKNIFHGSSLFVLGYSGYLGSWLWHCLSKTCLRYDVDLYLVGRDDSKLRDCSHQYTKFIPSKDLSSKLRSMQNLKNSIVIHAATPSGGISKIESDAIVQLTDQIYKNIGKVSNSVSFIHLSSGAVYQRSRETDEAYYESDPLIAKNSRDYYGLTKVKLENLTTQYGEKFKGNFCNLRLFSFIGSGMNVNSKFAANSFLKTARESGKIYITGSEFTKRSYSHPIDLFRAICEIKEHNIVGNYNFSTLPPINLGELAKSIASQFKDEIEIILSQGGIPNFYYANSEKFYQVSKGFAQFNLSHMVSEFVENT